MPAFEWEVERTPLKQHHEPVGQLKRRIGPLEAVAAAQRRPQGLQRGSSCAKERLEQVRGHDHLGARPPSHRRWTIARLARLLSHVGISLRPRLIRRWRVPVSRFCCHFRLDRVCTRNLGDLDFLPFSILTNGNGTTNWNF